MFGQFIRDMWYTLDSVLVPHSPRLMRRLNTELVKWGDGCRWFIYRKMGYNERFDLKLSAFGAEWLCEPIPEVVDS